MHQAEKESGAEIDAEEWEMVRFICGGRYVTRIFVIIQAVK
jgi:hypothetical protein